MINVYPHKTSNIVEAKKRIITLLKKGWCKQALAIDSTGRHLSQIDLGTKNKNIKSVCLLGACYCANIELSLIIPRLDKVIYETQSSVMGIGHFNDLQTNVEQVIDVVKKIN